MRVCMFFLFFFCSFFWISTWAHTARALQPAVAAQDRRCIGQRRCSWWRCCLRRLCRRCRNHRHAVVVVVGSDDAVDRRTIVALEQNFVVALHSQRVQWLRENTEREEVFFLFASTVLFDTFFFLAFNEDYLLALLPYEMNRFFKPNEGLSRAKNNLQIYK